MMLHTTLVRCMARLGLTVALAGVALLGLSLALSGGRVAMVLAQAGTGIIRIATGGTDAPGCGSAAQLCRTLQYAVDQAVPGDELRLAEGTYTGVSSRGGMSQIVYINKTVTIRGGYTTADWATPDPATHPTILDAAGQGRVISIMGPATVKLEGLRLINGKATNMGGLYMGQYTCNSTAGRGAGGGVCIQNAAASLTNVEIMTNTASASGGYGGGLFASGGTLTVTGSTIRGNQAGTGGNWSYGGGLALLGARAMVKDNLIASNAANRNYDGDGGGVYVKGAAALIQGNTIRENSVRGSTSSGARLGGGGVAVDGAGITLKGNRILANTATGYTGGGVAWRGGFITVTGNLVLNNAANWGGGLWAGNAPATVNNNVIADNTASGHGSAVYANTYSPNTPVFSHSTIARNSGGDGTAIYFEDYGRASFANTIIAGHAIGVGGGWGTSISLQQTLWDDNITDTVTLVNEVGHLTGSAAFAADGYHLTEPSAAVDAGIDAGVTSDIDGDPRPRGHAPDVGADESPYSRGAGGEEVSLEKLALSPRLMMSSRSMAGVPAYVMEQEYLIRLANGLPGTALSSYRLDDALPGDLEFAGQTHFPPMNFSRSGATLEWQSVAPLPAGNLAWVSLVGNAGLEDGGKVIANVAGVHYNLATGGSFDGTAAVSSLIPNFPPFIAWPENGEFCLDQAGNVEIRGLARPGATVFVYQDGQYQAQATASVTGTFHATYVPAQWSNDLSVVLTARDCSGGSCGTTSNAVTVRAPDMGWCPQRSVWQGTLGENFLHWPFRNASGQMATHDWEIPGAHGFWTTTLKLYACHVPDPGYTISDIVVDADGALYNDPDGPDPGGMWSFGISGAHTVNIAVTAKNDNPPGGTKVYTSHGWVLTDPDGFVFDVTKGLDVISATPDGVPIEVGNTVPGVTVTAMVSMPLWGGWVPWPAYLYDNQVNPQVTGADGYFAFLHASRILLSTSRRHPWLPVMAQPGDPGDHGDRARERALHAPCSRPVHPGCRDTSRHEPGRRHGGYRRQRRVGLDRRRRHHAGCAGELSAESGVAYTQPAGSADEHLGVGQRRVGTRENLWEAVRPCGDLRLHRWRRAHWYGRRQGTPLPANSVALYRRSVALIWRRPGSVCRFCRLPGQGSPGRRVQNELRAAKERDHPAGRRIAHLRIPDMGRATAMCLPGFAYNDPRTRRADKVRLQLDGGEAP